MSVAKKILEVMKEVEYLQKDGKVAFGSTKYNYLSEEKITSELRKAFVKIGLVIIPAKMEVLSEREVDTKSGKATITNISVTYKIICTETGESLEVQALGEGADSGDKNINKAMTGAFKYAQRQSFMIPTGDDPDHISSEELIGKEKKPGISVPEIKKNQPNEQVTLKCADDGKTITEAVYKYSMHNYGKPLCQDCQKKNAKVG